MPYIIENNLQRQTTLFLPRACVPLTVLGLAGSWFPDSPLSGFPPEVVRSGEEIHNLDSWHLFLITHMIVCIIK